MLYLSVEKIKEAIMNIKYKAYKFLINLANKMLKGASLANENLSNKDFSDKDLRDNDFSGANLRKTNFENSDLRGADLSNANLEQTNLRNTNLTGVDLTTAKSVGQADFTAATLKNLKLNKKKAKDIIANDTVDTGQTLDVLKSMPIKERTEMKDEFYGETAGKVKKAIQYVKTLSSEEMRQVSSVNKEVEGGKVR